MTYGRGWAEKRPGSDSPLVKLHGWWHGGTGVPICAACVHWHNHRMDRAFAVSLREKEVAIRKAVSNNCKALICFFASGRRRRAIGRNSDECGAAFRSPKRFTSQNIFIIYLFSSISLLSAKIACKIRMETFCASFNRENRRLLDSPLSD